MPRDMPGEEVLPSAMTHTRSKAHRPKVAQHSGDLTCNARTSLFSGKWPQERMVVRVHALSPPGLDLWPEGFSPSRRPALKGRSK